MPEQEIRLTIADFCEAEDVEGLMQYLSCDESEAKQMIESYKQSWEVRFPDRPKSFR